MSHTSPATYLVWSILICLLGVFLVYHLWSFDRFKCLKWNNGPYSGAFKRVMTYSYLLSVPLIMIYALGFAVIKYNQGYILIPDHGIVPTPYELWPASYQRVVFPLYLLFSVAWSLEMVTHLEELCFWLFLVNASHTQQDWFKSYYFKTWVTGSVLAVAYMPLVTIFTRSDHLKCEAYTFLAGSLGSLSLTIWFMPVLWTFPCFLRNLIAEGVDMQTVVRLTKFHEMNTLRILFRFLFVVPLLLLGVDGVRPHQDLNESMLITDVFAMLAGFGCVISSGMTLVIFFPRSVEGEILARDVSHNESPRSENRIPQNGNSQSQGSTYLITSSPVKEISDQSREYELSPALQKQDMWAYDRTSQSLRLPVSTALPPLSPNRRQADVAWAAAPSTEGGAALSEANLRRHTHRTSKYHRLVHTYTSPLDLAS